MNQLETLRRRLQLIRLVDRPYLYPSKQTLIERLSVDFDAVSDRTVERDIESIAKSYQIYIRHDRHRTGYYLDLPTDEDVADFEQFVQLLERRERLEFLTSAVDGSRGAGRYLQLERAASVNGAEHLPVLWQALRSGRCVTFAYQKFNEAVTPESLRLIEPGLLFEYRNRWYLDGQDAFDRRPRTFGVDRIVDLRLTDQPIRRSDADTHRTDRRHAIGVTCPADAEPQRVVLRFTAQEGKYVVSLPLHPSQQTLPTTDPAYLDVALWVILNHELEREILAFGEAVEVLEPAELRERIAARVMAMHRRYAAREEVSG